MASSIADAFLLARTLDETSVFRSSPSIQRVRILGQGWSAECGQVTKVRI